MKKTRKKGKILKTREQFREAVSYLKSSKTYIWLIIFIFLMNVIFGIIYAGQLGFLDAKIREIMESTKNLNTPELIFFILQNNLMSSFLGLVFGAFLGIFSILSTTVNGIFIGYALAKVVGKEGFFAVWRLFPHGIFELPAVIISLALGLKLGMFIFSKEKWKELKHRFYNSMNVFLVIVFPLLIIAAIIEGLLIALIG